MIPSPLVLLIAQLAKLAEENGSHLTQQQAEDVVQMYRDWHAQP
ncbi:hypothetical protein [Pseudoroseomonas ludipueritiae]|nr:hypothetical protein [Pseudoroseomonas ludipueritiae]